jgi:integrase
VVAIDDPASPGSDAAKLVLLGEVLKLRWRGLTPPLRVTLEVAPSPELAALGSRRTAMTRIHPHMLRHGCGYALANAGHDTRALQAWLGHKNIQHTVRYTELSPARFRDFWRENGR